MSHSTPTLFSFPEAALLLVSTKNRDLWPGPTFTDFPSLCACSESSLTNLIGSGLNLLCLKAIQNRDVVGPGQRSRFLVLTKRSAASGDENALTHGLASTLHMRTAHRSACRGRPAVRFPATSSHMCCVELAHKEVLYTRLSS